MSSHLHETPPDSRMNSIFPRLDFVFLSSAFARLAWSLIPLTLMWAVVFWAIR
jgi:hypothetical protein